MKILRPVKPVRAKRILKADAYQAPNFSNNEAPTEVMRNKEYREDPNIHSTDQETPLENKDQANGDAKPPQESDDAASKRNAILTNPIPLVISAPGAIEKMEELNKMISEDHPALAAETGAVAQALENLEHKAVGDTAPPADATGAIPIALGGQPGSEGDGGSGQASPGEFKVGDRVTMMLTDGKYSGEVQAVNEDGTLYTIKTDQMATFTNVPAASVGPSDQLSPIQPKASLKGKPMGRKAKPIKAADLEDAVPAVIDPAGAIAPAAVITEMPVTDRDALLHKTIEEWAQAKGVGVVPSDPDTAAYEAQMTECLEDLQARGVLPEPLQVLLPVKQVPADTAPVAVAEPVPAPVPAATGSEGIEPDLEAAQKVLAFHQVASADKFFVVLAGSKTGVSTPSNMVKLRAAIKAGATDDQFAGIFDDQTKADRFASIVAGKGLPVSAAIVTDQDVDKALRDYCKQKGRPYVAAGPEHDALVSEFSRHQVHSAMDTIESDFEKIGEKGYKHKHSNATIEPRIGRSATGSGDPKWKWTAIHSDGMTTSHKDVGEAMHAVKIHPANAKKVEASAGVKPVKQEADAMKPAAVIEASLETRVRAAGELGQKTPDELKSLIENWKNGLSRIPDGPGRAYVTSRISEAEKLLQQKQMSASLDELLVSDTAMKAAAMDPVYAAAIGDLKAAGPGDQVYIYAKADGTVYATQTKLETTVIPEADPVAAASVGLEVVASAFDKIEELEIGGGMTARSKGGKKEAGSEDGMGAGGEGKKEKGAEIEVRDKDGKVVETFPDAFGDDTVAIIKFLRQVLDIKDGDKGGDDGKPAGNKKDGGGEEAEPKKPAAAKPKESVADQPTVLPKVDKKEADLEAAKKLEAKAMEVRAARVQAKIDFCREIVAALVTKGHVVVAQADIDAELLKGNTLRDAQAVAARQKIDAEVMDLLGKEDAELRVLKASLPGLPVRQMRVHASMLSGLENLVNLSASGLIHEKNRAAENSGGIGLALSAAFSR